MTHVVVVIDTDNGSSNVQIQMASNNAQLNLSVSDKVLSVVKHNCK